MAVPRSRLEVFGVANALRHLRSYDKAAYRAITKEMRNSASALTSAVGGDYPERVLTNWNAEAPAQRRKAGKPFPLYDAAAARGGVKAKVGVGKLINNERTILRIQQMTAGGAVYDGSGSKSQNIFVKNLDTYGPAKGASRNGVSRSRVLYKAVDKRMDYVENVVSRAIEITNEAAQQAINAGVGR